MTPPPGSDPFALDGEPAPPHVPQREPAYLAGLNEPQREAVLATEGPVLVLAGAGTGKTRVLTTRLAHLIATGRARPAGLLAVTFTNKAAREMEDRIGRIVGPAVETMPWLGTFHSVAAKILRRHAELVGLKSNFTILDTDDQIRLLKQLIAAADIDEKRWPGRLMAGFIDSWKNRGLTPDKVPADESAQFADGRGAAVYRLYQDRLKMLNAADFGDLLLHNIEIFKAESEIRESYQRRFRYILVDEYQDTNVAQYLWLRLLAQKHRNICCVGDDDQSIYAWRGAEVGNILRFEKDFPGAKVIRLEQNYRSTQNILAVAAGLIANNRGRLGKTLWSAGADGEKVVVRGVWDSEEEARHVGQEIESLMRAGERLSEIAILVRATSQMRAFEDRFLTMGLPYRVVGGPRFYERREIRDALAYLRVIAQSDDDLALERIINLPKRGIGDKSLQTIRRAARNRQISLYAACELIVETDELPAKARGSLRSLIEDFERWRTMLGDEDHRTLAETVLEESGYTQMWMMEKSPDAQGRLENLAELVKAIGEFETLTGFLEHVSLVMENDTQAGGERVSLMTLHAAKGLEFDRVFLAGWEEGVFPNQRAMDEGGLAALEEERRLAYVGLTRARKHATILHVANRLLYGKWQSSIPSRFVEELPGELVDEVVDQGLYRGAWARADEDLFADVERSRRRGPGWQRAKSRGFNHGRTIEGEVEKLSVSAGAASDFAVGERVFHDKFGYGQIIDVEGNKLLITFDKAGEKRVVDSFVTSA